MRIVCISDTHGIFHPETLPDGDVLIHSGDLTLTGEAHEVQHALGWLRKFPHKHKLFVGGNHDNALCEFVYLFEDQMKPYKSFSPLIDMQGELLDIEGLKFFGSSVIPYNPVFRTGARAYMLDGTTARHWTLAPRCDVLITHGPPSGILDGQNESRYGDPILRNYVEQVKPKLHVFGHVHVGYGQLELGNTKFVNAALLNENYRPANEPIVVDI